MAAIDTSRLFRVDGLVAVITGGGTGIGRTMTLALATSGARHVFILGRRPEPLQETASQHPDIIIPIPCDVSDKASIQAAVNEITKRTTDDKSPGGFVNLVISNAGAFGQGHSLLSESGEGRASIAEIRQRLFDEADMGAFTNTLHVNVTGALFTVYALLELLDAGNKRSVAGQTEGIAVPTVQSQIVTVSSVAAFLRGSPAAASVSPSYGASKAALMHCTKQLSTMLGPFGIRANVLAPGLFPSDMAAGLIGDRKPEEEAPEYVSFIPAKRFGADEDMAGTILYLASRAGAYCNGMVLTPDGGRMSMGPATY